VDVAIRTVYRDEINADASDTLMSNLSLGGCFVATDKPSAVGTRVDLRFRLEDGAEPIAARGIVRWIKEGDGGGMGIQFEAVKGKDLLVLKRFIEQRLVDGIFG
jgi:uncharacterized protein (TIGR02266 family)